MRRLAACFHFTRVTSGGNPRPGYPRLDNGGAGGVTLPREGIVCWSSVAIRAAMRSARGCAKLYLQDGPSIDGGDVF
jgi:hypothetical protein